MGEDYFAGCAGVAEEVTWLRCFPVRSKREPVNLVAAGAVCCSGAL